MDLYHTTDAEGISELSPDKEKMREIIDCLDSEVYADSDHPDVSLVHDPSGWSLSLYPSGVVTFENLDEPDDLPRYMSGVSRNQALEMWIQLSKGRIDQVNSQPWLRDEA